MVSMVLINWNSRPFLAECIRSLRAQSYHNTELLIIDNCSTDGSQELLRTQYTEHHLLLASENLGYCGGANWGIRQSRGEYLLLLNPDVILDERFLVRLVETAERDPSLGIVVGKLLRFDRHTLDSTGQFLRRDFSPLERGYDEPDTGQYDQPGEVFSSCGAVAFYRRAMLEDIRLGDDYDDYFDASYFAFYEDLDVGWRAQLRGWKASYVPTAVAYHYRGGGLKDEKRPKAWFERLPFLPTVSLTQKPVFIQRHVIVNRYLTLVKNATWRDILRGLPALGKYELLLWGYVLLVRPKLVLTLLD
ncbi:glycosyltransferase, partial [candidate division KSB3 bacterium]|nr:glycosyltransferase [candidate division KSB3 bacterium]MBD3322961.1 glycosyltransferase [candidate division KSB3 bacterium]